MREPWNTIRIPINSTDGASLTMPNTPTTVTLMQRPLRQHAISNAPRILCLLVMLCASQARAEITYKEGEGWSFQGWLFDNLNLSTSSVASNSTEQLKIGLQFEKNGDEKKAVEAYRAVLKHFPLAPEAPLAVLRVAQIQDKRGDYERAFQFYDTYLEKYPEGDDFKAALDSMVKIAKRFMDGERRRLFGLKLFSSNVRAQEMLESILKRAPFSSGAAQIMLYRAAMLERQSKDQEAILAYQEILERFPSDPVAEDAQYQIGYIRLKGVKHGSYDAVDRIRAQESFEDFLNRAPASGKSTQARENLQKLDADQRKSTLEVAKFYEKTGKTKAAVVYYEDLIRLYPESEEGKTAKTRLSALKVQKGEDAASSSKEPAENAAKAEAKRAMAATVSTASRADYVGPQLKAQPQIEKAPSAPALRISPADINPDQPLFSSPAVPPSTSTPGTPKAGKNP